MYSCSFFGEMKPEEMTTEFKNYLNSVIIYLIVDKEVSAFYTISHSEFDRYCEDVVLKYRKLNPNIELMKFVPNKYKYKKDQL